MEVEITLSNNKVFTVKYEGTTQEFLDMVKYDAGTTLLQEVGGSYFLVRNISSFRFKN